MRRYKYFAASAVASTGSLGLTEISTPDDQVARTLKGVYVEPATAGIEVQLGGGGYTFASFDAAMCAAGNERVRVDEPFPPTVKFQVNIVNHTGSSYTGNLVLEYEPGPGAGGVSGAR